MDAPDQSEFGPTWYAATTPLPAPRNTLRFDLDADACVIGGGLAGLTAARELARRGWSVVLVEAHRIAWNASGRNSGFVLPGFSAKVEDIVERIGVPATKALWALSEQGVQYVKRTIAEIGTPEIEEGRGWLEVSKAPDADRARERIDLLAQEFGVELEAWPIERVRDVLRTKRYFHGIHFPDAFHINPLAYAFALATAAERAGVQIFEHSPALKIDPAGVRKRIVTPQGRVRVGHVVLAGNVHLGAVAQRLADTLVPVTAYTGVTKPLGPKLADAIGFAGAISDSRNANYHYRIVGGDRLMWTGAIAPFGGPPMLWRLLRAISSTYPELGRVEFDCYWAADMGFAVHRMPQVGEVQPDVWLASGFGGQGLNTSAVAGELVARGMVEGDDTWRLFMPYELVWAGGLAGRIVARTAAWWTNQSEQLAARLAQRHEESRRRRQREAAGLPAAEPRLAYRVKAAHATADRNVKDADRPVAAPEARPRSEARPRPRPEAQPRQAVDQGSL
jgi:glycine/D-amino acid oxidase-like deaminating enzyme